MSTAELPPALPTARPPHKTPAKVVVHTPWLGPMPDLRREPMPPEGIVLPTPKDLPCEDGAMENTFDHAKSTLLKGPLLPVLERLHPDGRFCVVHDTAFYYRTEPNRRSSAVVPDWAYVPGLPMLSEGEPQRSFLTWWEAVSPLIVLEYISDTDGGERDHTPEEGKFWIYERRLRPAYYGIYDVAPGRLEMYHLVDGRFDLMGANAHGRYPVHPLGLELGVWTGDFQGVMLPWMRWFHPDGTLMPTGSERAEQERQRAEQERQRADKLAAKLRELGVDPNQL
jgi:hypothetical protein